MQTAVRRRSFLKTATGMPLVIPYKECEVKEVFITIILYRGGVEVW